MTEQVSGADTAPVESHGNKRKASPDELKVDLFDRADMGGKGMQQTTVVLFAAATHYFKTRGIEPVDLIALKAALGDVVVNRIFVLNVAAAASNRNPRGELKSDLFWDRGDEATWGLKYMTYHKSPNGPALSHADVKPLFNKKSWLAKFTPRGVDALFEILTAEEDVVNYYVNIWRELVEKPMGDLVDKKRFKFGK